MSLFAPTFGGFGDFFTIYGVIQKFLQDKYHALDECRQLCAYLGEFTMALKFVALLACQSIQTAHPPSSTPNTHLTIGCALPPSPASDEYSASLAAIGHAIEQCNNAIQKFQQRLAHIEAALRREKPSTWVYWVRDAVYEAAYPASSFNIQRESKALKEKLIEEAQVIGLILNAHAAARHLQVTHRQFQPVIRGPSIAVYLTDILNDEDCVPWEFCASKALFQQFLVFRFSTLQRTGQTLVKRNRYYLQLANTKEIVRSKTWARIVEPGAHVLMNAFIIRHDDDDDQICPSCQTKSCVSVFQNGYEVICPSCAKTLAVYGASAKTYSFPEPNHPAGLGEKKPLPSTRRLTGDAAKPGVSRPRSSSVDLVSPGTLIGGRTPTPIPRSVAVGACILSDPDMPAVCRITTCSFVDLVRLHSEADIACTESATSELDMTAVSSTLLVD